MIIHNMKKFIAIKPHMIIISGSTQNFRRERQKIMEVIGELEWGAHTICSNCEVSSNGSAMGWDFFKICIDPDFIERLLEIHPDIQKGEGHMIEQQFVLWLSKQFKNKIKSEYHLKLSDVPYEHTRGFKLNQENS